MLRGFVSSLEDAGPAAVKLGKAWDATSSSAPRRPSTSTPGKRWTGSIEYWTRSASRYDVRATQGDTEVRLQRCPFREVAEKRTEDVCQIHLGLMQGALDELGAPLGATSLDPLVTPQLCLAHLAPAQPSDV